MKLLSRIFSFLFDFFRDPKTLEKARIKEHAFTRKGKLPFYICLILGLAHFTGSLAYGLDEFFALELGLETIVTGSAYTQDREKFDHSPYETAFEKIRDMIDDDYSKTGALKTRFDLQVIAVDGSLVALPDKKSLLEEFGGVGRGAKSPAARMTILYDTLNDIIYEATLEPLAVGEREQAKELIKRLSKHADLSKMLFVFDRGYFSSDLINFLESQGTHYLMRVRRNLRWTIDSAPLGDNEIFVDRKKKRLLKFPITNSEKGNQEIEMLLTNLKEPSLEDFKELYFLRWPIETEYDTIKNKIEMPNFNATLKNGIYQDFWISMVIANITSVVLVEVDKIIASRHRNHKDKHKYQADISEAVNSIHVDLPRILMAENEEKRKQRITHLLSYASENEEPVRPNRSVSRSLVRKARYHYNRKHH